MQYIMDIKDEPHERPTQGTNGDYPEISFTFISNTIEGLMGIKPDAGNNKIITASHLTGDIDWLEVTQLPVGTHEVTVRHDGVNQTTFTNDSTLPLLWEAWFYGDYASLIVDGQSVTATKKLINGQTVSSVQISVSSEETRVVQK